MQRLILTSAVLTLTLWSAGRSAVPLGSGNDASDSEVGANLEVEWRAHTVGDVVAKVGNNGTIGGRELGSAAEPDSGSNIVGAFVFRENGAEHLFDAGLWIGGMIGADTVVAAAVFANSRMSTAYEPTVDFQTAYQPKEGWQTFATEYSVLPDPEDPSSLGLNVRQVSHQFTSRPYDQFILIEYTIRNTSQSPLQGIHVGMFADPDISSAGNDLSGFLRPEGIAYTIDNDTQPVSSAFGMVPIHLSPQPCCTTYNWFATDHRDIWWGPTRDEIGRAEVLTGSGMYRVMANREFDYDQWLAQHDFSSEGWDPPPSDSVAQDVSTGLDTRWVLAYDFAELQVGDSILLTISLTVGDSVRTTVGPPDTTSMNFAELRRNVDFARLVWDNGFVLENASPFRLVVEAVADTAVTCRWSPAPYDDASRYRVFRRRVGENGWVIVRTVGSDTTRVTDYDLVPGYKYEYSVASMDHEGAVGPGSRTVQVRVGFPLVAPTLTGRTTPAAVGLNWSIPQTESGYASFTWIDIHRTTVSPIWGEDDSSAHFRIPILHRQSDIRSEPATAPLLPDEFSMQPFDFVDNSVKSAVNYSYNAYLTNSLGNRGPSSPSVQVTPMRPRFNGLVLMFTNGSRRSLNDIDYSTAFYTSWADRFGFRVIESDRTTPLLRVMAMYRCIVVVMEDAIAEFPTGIAQSDLDTYLENNGPVVFVARNHEPSTVNGHPHPLLGRFLGISRTYLESPWEDFGPYSSPRDYMYAGFTHAASHSPSYPTLEGDSAKAWALNFWQESAQRVDSVYAAGFVPAIGAVDLLSPETEVLYTYVSAYDTSFFHGRPIGVRRITDSSAAILFNFPLSLMKHEQAWQALSQAVADLGVDTTNYFPPTQSTTHAIIEWLYGNHASTPNPTWDTNSDGVIDIRDVVETLER